MYSNLHQSAKAVVCCKVTLLSSLYANAWDLPQMFNAFSFLTANLSSVLGSVHSIPCWAKGGGYRCSGSILIHLLLQIYIFFGTWQITSTCTLQHIFSVLKMIHLPEEEVCLVHFQHEMSWSVLTLRSRERKGGGTPCIDIVGHGAYWVNEVRWTTNNSKSSLVPFLSLFNKSIYVCFVLSDAERHIHSRWYLSEEHHRPEATYILGSLFFDIHSLLQVGYAKWCHQVQ